MGANTPDVSIEKAHLVVQIASDGHAFDIVMLDMTKVAYFTDIFVVMTVDSSRQMGALSQDIEDELKANKIKLHHKEGTPQSGWLLLDFSDLIVHIFRPESRSYYQIEDLWHSAAEVVRIQ